ncbi:MAG: glutamate racemase [Anaerolineales bacterium]|nr:glutamate racemase [Anaerolineales bacterium]
MNKPIGIFDSGIGGLSVLREIRERLPGEDLIYIADQAHVPYGPRSMAEVKLFSRGIVRYLLDQGVKLVVVACNTASAAALADLRREFPGVPFVGMEPAVKPAAEKTVSGVVGVLATPATFQGELYHRTVERFASGVTVLQHTLPGLVDQIEQGEITTQKTRAVLAAALRPMMDQGVDKIVLGCTHYPFVIPLIQEIVGEEVQVIDPSPAVARQAARLLAERQLIGSSARIGKIRFLTTGNEEDFGKIVQHLLAEKGEIGGLNWSGDRLGERV